MVKTIETGNIIVNEFSDNELQQLRAIIQTNCTDEQFDRVLLIRRILQYNIVDANKLALELYETDFKDSPMGAEYKLKNTEDSKTLSRASNMPATILDENNAAATVSSFIDWWLDCIKK